MLQVLRISIFIIIASLISTPAQKKSKPTPAILFTVDGAVARPLKLTESDLAKLPRRTVTIKDGTGATVTYEGIPLVEITRLAGVPYGDDLKGEHMSTYIVAKSSVDSFRAIFVLPELDPTYTDNLVLLADKKDNQQLPASEGRLRIIASGDKRPSRWVKQAISLTVLKSRK